jgi:hypothetical protein
VCRQIGITAPVLGPNRRRLDRWRALSEAEREGFPPLCPDLVVELASPSDLLEPLRQKMASYISNGARLGWHLVAITTPLSTRFQCHSGWMARLAESTTDANASVSGTASSTAEAAGDQDSVGEGAVMSPVETRLIKQVELLLRESGTTEPFDASAWVERWLRRPNQALGGGAPELYLHTPQGEALLSNLIGAMAAGSYM